MSVPTVAKGPVCSRGWLVGVSLRAMPLVQTCTTAALFRCAGCRAELAKLSERHGTDYVVTEADIKAATTAAMAAALGGSH